MREELKDAADFGWDIAEPSFDWRRLLAKMAFAYQEAGFEIGDFVAFVIYPLTTTEPPGEWAPGIPLRSAIGWEPAARNLLK